MGKFNPKVSIIIPVYNGANYLREAIDSALSQTYKNLEIIVINDGSNDDGKTKKICKSYGDKIRYYEKENGGVASALNMGIDKMEGEYFSWLSHDDKYLPQKIEKQIEYLSTVESKDVVLYMDYGLIDEKSKKIQSGSLDHEMLIEKPEYSLLRGCVNGITLLIPRKAFNYSGYFNLELRCTQDYDMWRRIIKKYKFVHLPISLTQTRIHALQDSNKHPNVQKEGNPLWIGMMKDISLKDKERLEGTEYNFYYEMAKFLKNTPYSGALEFAESKMLEIYEDKRKVNPNTLISVIIPFYNRLPLLKNSINSVLRQTYDNFELILVNDGSSEDVSEISEFKDKRIRLINLEKNKGAAHARNVGIKEAKGKYIAFLDSDDQFLPEKLENQKNLMEITNYNVSHTSYIRRELNSDRIMSSGEVSGTVIPTIIASCPIATPTVMIKKDFLKRNDFKFREDFHIGEDVCFWLDILRKEKLLGINKVYTIVNVNNKSAINSSEKQIIGLGNILNFVLSDKEMSNYHKEIGHLCRVYAELAGEIVSSIGISEKQVFSNPLSKLLYLFKYQGIPLTIKKIAWKYFPKAINKAKNIINGKR